MQEVIPDDDLSKPVDTFHVRISNVRAVLRIAEARPVLLTFEFDNYLYAETDVYSKDVEPSWGFNTASIRGNDGWKPSSDSEGSESFVSPARNGLVQPEAKFIYKTEFGYKLHRKFLIVKLSERSPYTDVEWGSGVLPLDSIARGCHSVEISMVAKDNVTCYGSVFCNIAMTNVQTVRAHLTDLKLSGYPEAYNYDVKLIYMEFGLNGFENGYNKCTEKRSDSEPRYSAQPALEWDTTLRDMLISSSSRTGASSLKIYFSVHRQVARNRTEEIGVGALPVRMLFSKITEGWMDLPTKFKVPLANYKGDIRGKVLLRNIPQFSQLSGSDIVNVNGTIMPLEADLESRKLLPWVKLPRSREGKPMPVNGTVAKSLERTTSKGAPGWTVANGVGQHAATAVAKTNVAGHVSSGGQYHSSVTESEGGSESSSVGESPSRQKATRAVATQEPDSSQTHKQRSQFAAVRANERQAANSPLDVRDQIYETGAEDMSVDAVRQRIAAMHNSHYVYGPRTSRVGSPKREEIREAEEMNVKPVAGLSLVEQMVQKHEQMRATQRMEVTANTSTEAEGVHLGARRSSGGRREREVSRLEHSGSATRRVESGVARRDWRQVESQEDMDDLGRLRISGEEAEGRTVARLRSDMRGQEYYEGPVWEDHESNGNMLRERVIKSGKSIGSVGTGDGGVEIGSVVLSTGSDEGFVTGSRTTTEDVLIISQRLSTGPPSVDGEEFEMVDGRRTEEEEDDEWMAVLDPASSRHYFAHRFTQESLWLPPEWERLEDDEGRQYFVDHGNRTSQRAFPAKEARAYRESVYTSL